MAAADLKVDPVLADTRARILAAAAKLVADGGVAALTTRAVASAASVQAPTLYRLFGDKRGLLDAVAEHGLASYVAGKRHAVPDGDPVQDLCDAFDAHVAFGLSNPAVFAIMSDVGRNAPPSTAMRAGLAVLRERVQRIALTGRLRVSQDRAVSLLQAVGNGVIATLLAMSEEEREPGLSAAGRDAVIDAIVERERGAEASGVASLAVGLRAHLSAIDALSAGERALMRELLDRISESSK